MGVDRPSGSSRALRLDPHALPVRYAARDSGAAELDGTELLLAALMVWLTNVIVFAS